MTIEKHPFEDVFPIKRLGGFPLYVGIDDGFVDLAQKMVEAEQIFNMLDANGDDEVHYSATRRFFLD